MPVITMATDFTRMPAGRYSRDGKFSGQRFREEFLVPNLGVGPDPLIVDLDGAIGYGSSFLEEAFGGLIREGFSPAELRQWLIVRSSDSSLVDEIWEYIASERG